MTVSIRSGASDGALQVNGVDAVVFNAGGIVTGGPASGFKNKIIGGNFNVAQRGANYALTNFITYGSVDRFNVWQGGATASGIANQVASGLTGFSAALKIGRNSGSAIANTINILYALESGDSVPLQGQTVTLSFYAKAGANYSAVNNNLTVLIWAGTGIDQPAANVATWTGSATPINTQQAITTSWVRYSFTTFIPSTVTQLAFALSYATTGTAGADDNLYVTGCQLEAGSTATQFETRSVGTELALCQRYYTVLGSSDTYPVTTSVISTAARGYFSLPVTMRIPPICVFTYSSGGTGAVFSIGQNGGFQTANHSTTTGFSLTASSEL